jgi:hypothetical protein
MKKSNLLWLVLLPMLVMSVAWGQTDRPSSKDTPQMSSDMKDMPDMDGNAGATADHAMHSMEMRHMDMGPHMKMTALREPNPTDDERAEKIVAGARAAAERYQDYHVALGDGFKIFLPNVAQKQYHFTSRRNAIEAQFRFNPERPTSLLYEKHGDDYKLIGVMYTAPKRMSENDLNKRIPLSVAQWHEHVNLCVPPKDRRQELWGPHPQFGLNGSIATKQECDTAGGKFYPVIFNWMVHVYPFEKDKQSIWDVDRQHDHDGD